MHGAVHSHTVIGAGPAGLVAAMTLARQQRSVRVYEKAESVGHRFAGDFQGLENWSSSVDALERLDRMGIEPSFAHKPFHEVTFYDRALRPAHARSQRPLFYLVRRGSEAGSLDRALLDQARGAGAEVLLGRRAEHALRGDILATGPRYADGIATGYVFPTSLEDQAHCIVSEELAPAGYAYLLVWDGKATLATCSFRKTSDWKEARRRTVETFTRLIPNLDMGEARPFTGYGSVFGKTGFDDEAGRLFVGEAAGLQDPEWGFGMWYAMESGSLAARSLIDDFDYAHEAERSFRRRREVALFNRLMFERLPEAFVPYLLHRHASSPDLMRQLSRHWAPNIVKSTIAAASLSRFSRRRLDHPDRACHTATCDCVWCTHGTTDDVSHGGCSGGVPTTEHSARTNA